MLHNKRILSYKTAKTLQMVLLLILALGLCTPRLWAQRPAQLQQKITHFTASPILPKADISSGAPSHHILCDSVHGDSIIVTYMGLCNFHFEVANPQFIVGYEWSFGDASVNVNSPDVFHSYIINGTYHVKVIISNACNSDTLYTTVTCIDSSTGIATLPSTQPAITLSPNPVYRTLTIHYPGASGKVHIQITDLTGRVIQSEMAIMNSDYRSVDVRKLMSGMYFLEIGNGQKKSTVKFVKR